MSPEHPSPESSQAPRHDLYSGIHKALRALMADSLLAVGQLDPEDAEDVGATSDRVETMLVLMAAHLKQESQFVHPAIEARRPGGSADVEAEHRQHARHLDRLSAAVGTLRDAQGAARALQAQTLYRELSLFMADNLRHMVVEEAQHNALLWAAYSDAELQALHLRLRASIEPLVMRHTLRWIAQGFHVRELASMLQEQQQSLHPEAALAVMDQIREVLGAQRWSKLSAILASTQTAASGHAMDATA